MTRCGMWGAPPVEMLYFLGYSSKTYCTFQPHLHDNRTMKTNGAEIGIPGWTAAPRIGSIGRGWSRLGTGRRVARRTPPERACTIPGRRAVAHDTRVSTSIDRRTPRLLPGAPALIVCARPWAPWAGEPLAVPLLAPPLARPPLPPPPGAVSWTCL